jgi:putative CocE/NonD family hydrolase
VTVAKVCRRPLATALGALLMLTGLALVPAVADPPTAVAAPTGFVTMSDGIQIAVNVRLPDGYVQGKRYPTVFEMSGYDGGSADGGTLLNDFGLAEVGEQVPGFPLPADDSRQLTDIFTTEYVTVHASVRGTGCSSGQFDLFSSRSALDGKEIIDGWVPQQAWSNGKVGIVGHSYGGITGWMVTATQPTHLRAASLSGLIDDMYRAMVYPGGVTNYGFPLLWTLGVRPAYDVAGGLLPGIVRPEGPDDDPNRQEDCALSSLGKSRTVVDDPVLQGLSETDNDWYRSRSLITYVDQIEVPVHIVGAYQDEQTGPRGPAHLYERLAGVPKRLLLTNGDHNTETLAEYGSEPIRQDRKAWIDHFVRGANRGFGSVAQAKRSATVFFEMHGDDGGHLVPNGRKDGTDFPLPDTKWADWYLHGDGSLNANAPAASEPARPYVTGTKRQLWSYQAGGDVGPPITTADGPDELTYESAPFTQSTAIAGPMAATLHVQSTAPDTELFVELVDEAPDGTHTYLQRGLLRASHRAVDASQSQKTPDGRIYRPHRPHTNPTTITPLQTYEYLIEIFPVGHVFRPGHRMLVKVHAPPFVDSYYVYVPRSAPGVNTILSGPDTPSRLLVPFVPLTGVQLGPELPCGAQEAVRCVADPGPALPLPTLPVVTLPPLTLPPATLPPTTLPPATVPPTTLPPLTLPGARP